MFDFMRSMVNHPSKKAILFGLFDQYRSGGLIQPTSLLSNHSLVTLRSEILYKQQVMDYKFNLTELKDNKNPDLLTHDNQLDDKS